ncbi:MAG TPA: PadR family transcriptional regulator [Rectinemataceae bacterium]|nr:PadR family transcriptional regulator [Rectinemataceae bacterium]
MSIRTAILGFLSWKPFTGYELKKFFADALSFHWSGNNNQIYGSLVELHKDGAVTIEVQQQDKLPARKVYTITDRGLEELRAWLLSEPELPAVRSDFTTRLSWAAQLSPAELEQMLDAYERQLLAQVLMYREKLARGTISPSRTPLEKRLWESIEVHAIAFYEQELQWVKGLREDLQHDEAGPKTRAGGRGHRAPRRSVSRS